MAGGKGGGTNGGAGGAGGSGYPPQDGSAGTGDSGGGGAGAGFTAPLGGVGAGQGGNGGGGGRNGYVGSGTKFVKNFTGGNGQNGAAAGFNGGGGGGGGGGYGAVATGASVENAASLTGGMGGNGGGAYSPFTVGYGGSGGAGLLTTATSATVVNDNSGKALGGSGGLLAAGGAGIMSNGSSTNLSNAGTATGGTGGGLGAGGAGIAFTSSGALTNQSTGVVTGGTGGVDWASWMDGTATVFRGGDPGDGGAGVAFLTSGGTVTNAGTINGGHSGLNEYGGGAGAFGGAGVVGSGLTVVNTGTIAGGFGGSKRGQADAITFTDGANTLALGANAQFNGALDIQAATGTLKFDQSQGASGGIAAHSNATVSVAIVGAGAVIKADTGTLTFTAADTYASGTTISAGTLQLGDGTTNGSVAGAITNNGVLVLDPNGMQTFANSISGIGTLSKIGTGTAILSGTGTYSGSTKISAGTLQLGDGTTNGSVASAITDNGVLALDPNGAQTFANRIGGSGALSKIGTGTAVLSGANSYLGGTTFAGGELSAADDGKLGAASGGLTFNGGILQITGTMFTSTVRTITWGTQGGGFDIASAGNNFTVSQSLTNGGALTKTGAGTLTLSGTNTYSGGTTVDAGTLSISSDGNLGDTSGGLTLAGGTLETTAAVTSARGIMLDGTGTVQVDSGVSTTLSGIIGNGASTGYFYKTGAGTLTLSGANTYSGFTEIDAGTLAISSDGNNSVYNLGASSGALTFGGGTLETTATLSSGRYITLGQTGVIQVDAGSGTTPNVTTLSGRISGGAGLTKTGGGTLTLSFGGNTYTGGTTIEGGTLDLTAATTATQGSAGTGDITFDGSSGSPATLALDSAAQPMSGGTFDNTLDNFGDDDQLDLKGLVYNGLSSVTPLAPIGNTLSVSESGDTENFTLGGTHPTAYYARSDGDGGTLVTDSPVCFASGTLIRTVRGDTAVEDLAVGDLVVTSAGEHRPIKWLGHRTIDCGRHSHPEKVRPVRIAAHALGPDKPARDLYVSPGHSICLDLVGEVLIPAAALINGSTVRQVEVDEVTYWHVELDSHDVILAENLAAESYLDMGNRDFFAEGDVVRLDMSPDANPDPEATRLSHADFCRPYHDGGPLVEAVRAQTWARAVALGWSLSTALDVHLEIDGRRVDPVVRDRTIRFLVPAGAKDVYLMSPTARPCDSAIGSADDRALGVDLTALHIDDGFGSSRDIAIDDPLLDAGFSQLEAGHRWTTGRARLPADLWRGCTDTFFLRLDLGGAPAPRWMGPTNTSELGKAA